MIEIIIKQPISISEEKAHFIGEVETVHRVKSIIVDGKLSIFKIYLLIALLTDAIHLLLLAIHNQMYR